MLILYDEAIILNFYPKLGKINYLSLKYTIEEKTVQLQKGRINKKGNKFGVA